MKIKFDRKIIIIISIAIILASLIWGIVIHWHNIFRVFKYIFYSAVLAYILTPVSRWLERYVIRPRAVLILFFIIFFMAFSLIALLIPILIRQSIALIEMLPIFSRQIQGFLTRLQQTMERVGLPYGIQIAFNEYIGKLESWFTFFIKDRMDGAVDGMGEIAIFFTIPVLSYYFLKDRDYFKKIILMLVPIKIRKPVKQTAVEISRILDKYIRGQLLIALIVGILATIGYLIIRLPYAVLMGLFAGIFEIIPYFGPVLGAIPAGMIAVLHSPSKLVASIIVIILVQQLESNIFTPKIMGSQVGLHPVYIILVLWASGMFWGLVGMFFAVPMVLVLKVIIKNLYIAIVSDSY
ncbi:MAG: AI-2E family transporter [Clostridiales bacterium]|nr:AI-2E family transporter [Clostridiales bacterium]